MARPYIPCNGDLRFCYKKKIKKKRKQNAWDNPLHMLNSFSTGTHVYQEFLYDETILLTLWKVYGRQTMNVQNLYHFNPHLSF